MAESCELEQCIAMSAARLEKVASLTRGKSTSPKTIKQKCLAVLQFMLSSSPSFSGMSPRQLLWRNFRGAERSEDGHLVLRADALHAILRSSTTPTEMLHLLALGGTIQSDLTGYVCVIGTMDTASRCPQLSCSRTWDHTGGFIFLEDSSSKQSKRSLRS